MNLTKDQRALRDFDGLPNSAHVRISVVMGLFGISRATVWRRVEAQRLPEPRFFSDEEGSSGVWNVGQLRAVIAAK